MSFLNFLNLLGNSTWAVGLKQSTILFPIVEGSHILSLSLLLSVKILLLALAGINALVYHFRYYPEMPQWDLAVTPVGARIDAVLLLGF